MTQSRTMIRPASLDELRKTILEEDRRLLDLCWAEYTPGKNKLKARRAYRALGKPDVDSSVARLTKALIHKSWGSTPGDEYEITYLGALTSSEGNRLEHLIVRFLVAMQAFYEKNHEKSFIKNTELANHFDATGGDLSDGDLNDLGKVLGLGVMLCGLSVTSAQPDGSWSINIQDEIDDIRRISDFPEYVSRELSSKYDAAEPTSQIEHNNSIFAKNRSSSMGFDGTLENKHVIEEGTEINFTFVRDEKLREICNSDWKEALEAKKYGLIKAAIILCGAVVEGLLLDAFEQVDQVELSTACKAKGIKPKLEYMGLDDLVKVGTALKIIRSTSEHLAQFLREYRNFVHPHRQRKESIAITSDEIDVAILAIRHLVRDLYRNK